MQRNNFKEGPLASSWFFLKRWYKVMPLNLKNLKCLSFGECLSLSIIIVWWMEMEYLGLEPSRMMGHWVNCVHLVLVCHCSCPQRVSVFRPQLENKRSKILKHLKKFYEASLLSDRLYPRIQLLIKFRWEFRNLNISCVLILSD